MLEHGGRLLRAARRYGIEPARWLDLSTGIAPFAWPVPAVPASAWHRLPEDDDGLIEAACDYYHAPHLLPVAGSQAAIQALPRLRARSRVGVIAPGYAEHAHAWRSAGHAVETLSADALVAQHERFDVVVLIHPNNPGGNRFPRATLLALHDALARRGGLLVVDEAFMDATPEHSLCRESDRDGLIVLRSVGKFFGLAGARAGFACAAPSLLEPLRRMLGPWTLAGPSRYVLRMALADRAWQAQQRERLTAAAERLRGVLLAHALEPTAGCAFFQWRRDARAARLHEALASARHPHAPVRRARKPAHGPAAGRRRIRTALARTGRGGRMSARVLMVQGCTSDAGKSTLVAALCRWLHRRGVRVAPFKPQNMALNSAVTADGGEIGRAQAVQAQACGLAPHTDFNPVLLKPNSDTGAQVIVHGRAVANFDARTYHDYKRIARDAVLASHARLCAGYDAVIVEGAGSPAEINLRANDIANMGYAEAVDCPVILVADIDRGGVFAHLVGTLALLSQSERARVRGFVINRFRGDIALLQPGLDWLERETGKPVLGVLPYLHGLHLEAEDALPAARQAGREARLRVVVPALPRISNHTDFDALRAHPQVELAFVGPSQAPPSCDLIVLPGSKSTRADLAWLRAHGWEPLLARHLRYGGKVIGICGGLQMLGRRVDDPDGIEGDAGSSEGLGWLDLHTTLAPHKQLRNVRGTLALDGSAVRGYEIHCGISEGPALSAPACRLDDARVDGAMSADGQVMGTYLHGVFDHPQALRALLRWAGLHDAEPLEIHALREASIERLADAVEKHLDAAALCRLLGRESPCAA